MNQLEKLSNKNRELSEQISTLNRDLKSSKEEITNLSSQNQIIESKRQESKAETVCLKQKCEGLELQLRRAKVDIEKFEIRVNEVNEVNEEIFDGLTTCLEGWKKRAKDLQKSYEMSEQRQKVK